MSVDAFRLENFMAFEDTGWIELRKINLLLGRNSSGKSAVIRALRLLKQSLLNEERTGNPLTFSVEGGVDLGSFNQMLHRKPLPPEKPETEKGTEEAEEDPYDVEERKRYSDLVTFSFRGKLSAKDWETAVRTSLLAPLGLSDDGAIDALLFHASASYRQDKWNGQVYLWKLELGVCERLTSDDFSLVWGYEITDVGFDSFEVYLYSPVLNNIASQLNEIFGVSSYTSFLPDINVKETAPSQLEQLEAITNFWNTCKGEIINWLKSIVHVGPVRPLPRRSYALTEEFRRAWEIGGWQAFLDYLERIDDERDKKVNGWLQTLKLGHALKRYTMVKSEFEKELVAIKLRLDEAGHGDERDITDIGFGASQILPVIVQCLSADENALVLVEQPELHLHPEAQADVADMFVESVNETVVPRLDLHPQQLGEEAKTAREEEKRRPVTRRYLVETHSEHILLRLQGRIVETTYVTRQSETSQSANKQSLSVEKIDFNLVFVRRGGGISFTEFLEVDEKGDPDAPSMEFQVFFDAAYQEVVRLSNMKRDLEALEVSNEIGN